MGNSYAKTNGYSANVTGESHFASLGPNKIHYVILGKGTRDIVFIHGWAGHLGVWREQIPALMEGARLIFVDLPGHGKSDKPETAYTMDFFAESVLAVLSAAKVDKAIFIGHSMGGAVISTMHRRAPEKIAALVSVDGLLRRPTGTAEQIEALVVPFGKPQYLDHARNVINGFFPTPGTEALRDQVMAEMLTTPQHVMLGGMKAMFGVDQCDWVMQRVNAPVAVINAPGFWWSHGFESYVRSLTPQSDYMVMDGVGHFPMLEKPAEFNATLTTLLRKFALPA
jgi:pimeloyl-ACP methyl ester carboxylesterase